MHPSLLAVIELKIMGKRSKNEPSRILNNRGFGTEINIVRQSYSSASFK